MAERTGYMRQLDGWTDETILRPIDEAWYAYYTGEGEEERRGAEERLTQVEIQVRKAIREKVLESYRNGQQVGPQRQPVESVEQGRPRTPRRARLSA